MSKLIGGVLLLTLAIVNDALARAEFLCDQAARDASVEYDVPLEILRAITRTETGRTLEGVLKPWPWAVNVAGEGHWFETREIAIDHVKRHVASGRRNIDIGCFQLNHRWHAAGFASIGDMFDPVANARYAAQFLTDLYDEKGDWMRAVGAYHSRTAVHAKRYKRRFSDIYADLKDDSDGRSTASLQHRTTGRFPLLRPTATRPLRGSLVPLDNTVSRGALLSREGGL
ncbi:transglycosylase SLT domain-containing protein [uncultured Roseobacter sp.]|uniref:transglycosylase SLT domain-containing protein n=1 Tax=uncultured Roseobacter sp. TaxID=114847 RepID=UPI0026085EC3|nr:transglycosylase SLT domain-containing protein [uncultured Roseobacter sp.]